MKKRSKALLVMVTALLVLALCCGAASASTFTDTGSHWAKDAIATWSNKALVNGYADGGFHPNANITRAELAAILNRILNNDATGKTSFSDVAKDAWYAADVLALADAGVVTGADGAFRPNDAVTREEVAVMLNRAFTLEAGTASFTDNAKVSSWAVDAVGALAKAGYIGGYTDGSFQPQGNITRAELMKIVDNAKALVSAALLAAPRTLDGAYTPSYDLSQAVQLPMTGYFEKTLASGRTVEIYISDNAPIRSYFTVIAVPDGVDTAAFLKDSGWFAKADTLGECLYILKPVDQKWGALEDESQYVAEAMKYFSAPKADKGYITDPEKSANYFSNFGEHYLVGYGAGAPALEAWAVVNPIFVISQVYLDNDGLTAAYLGEKGAGEYEGTTDEVKATLAAKGLANIKYNEVPVPTWFVNYGSESVSYWKAANDCVTGSSSGDYGKEYAQAKNSDAWATNYCGPISKVAVSTAKLTYTDAKTTEAIWSFMTEYTRYDNSSAYGNQLAYRLVYNEALTGAQTKGVGEQKLSNGATMIAGVMNFADNKVAQGGVGAKDNVADPQEYLIYIPTSVADHGKQGAPVLFVWAGNSQTDRIFFDCTQWWQVADEEGIILVFPCETYSNNSVSVSQNGVWDQFDALTDLMKKDSATYPADWSRVYCTGQSAGSGITLLFSHRTPELLAAVGCTSGGVAPGDGQSNSAIEPAEPCNKPIPAIFCVGQADIEARRNTLWDDTDEKNTTDPIVAYYLKVNNLGTVNDFDDNYQTGVYNRHNVYTWNNSQELPLFRFIDTAFRPHNCFPSEMPMLWDFLEHFSFKTNADGTVTRYYSPSAFAKDGDLVEINF